MAMQSSKLELSRILRARPQARAIVRGSAEYPDVRGRLRFYQTSRGVITVSEFFGLPVMNGKCDTGIFGFHIHSGRSCTGTASDPFANVNGHYDKGACPHPFHTGDMPPIFGAANGYAFSAFLSSRFTVREIIGRAVILHAQRDDFTTQPSGDSGKMIACGLIVSV